MVWVGITINGDQSLVNIYIYRLRCMSSAFGSCHFQLKRGFQNAAVVVCYDTKVTTTEYRKRVELVGNTKSEFDESETLCHAQVTDFLIQGSEFTEQNFCDHIRKYCVIMHNVSSWIRKRLLQMNSEIESMELNFANMVIE